MSRTTNLMIRDDGVATIYDDTYDITIHCENEEEQHKVVELLKSVPSAQPERKTGKWIETEGLDEEIRCIMCSNPMKTNSGCDGHCQYNEHLYHEIISVLENRITKVE